MSENSVNDRNKKVWTDADFDNMNWHNCKIYGVAFYPKTFELAFDIDYVFNTEKHETHYTFWISPATLVFSNVHDLELSIESSDGQFQIVSIDRTDIGKPINHEHIKRDTDWLWTIECWEGEIKLKAVGFDQYIRRPAINTEEQNLLLEERGELSFARQYIGPIKDA